MNGEEIAYARRKNMRHLWSLLNGKVEMVPGLERCMEGAPFSLPILIDNRDEVQSTLAKEVSIRSCCGLFARRLSRCVACRR